MKSTLPLSKDIKLVHALMELKRVNILALSKNTGVQLENLKAWLQGNSSALGSRSYVAVLNHLGMTKEGFAKTHVLTWYMECGSSLNEHQQELLRCVSPYLKGGQLVELEGAWQPIHGKVRLFALRGEGYKILIMLKGGLRKPAAIQNDMFAGVQDYSGENGSNVVKVEPQYWLAVRNGQITPSEFDDLFYGRAAQCSWNDLRLLARERGITPFMLSQDILVKEQGAQEEQYAGVVQTVAAAVQEEQAHVEMVPVMAETKVSASTPVRRRRAATTDDRGDANVVSSIDQEQPSGQVMAEAFQHDSKQ